MLTPTDTRGSARLLLCALLPPEWRERDALLAAAHDLDVQHDGVGLCVLLSAWSAYRACGALPTGLLRDLVLALAQVMGAGERVPRRRSSGPPAASGPDERDGSLLPRRSRHEGGGETGGCDCGEGEIR